RERRSRSNVTTDPQLRFHHLRRAMCHVDPGDEGNPYDSDNAVDINSDDDEIVWLPGWGGGTSSQRTERDVLMEPANIEPTMSAADIEKLSGVTWRDTEVSGLPEPAGLKEKENSTLKEASAHLFDTSLSSFLAFIPIFFWELLTFESNRYAEQTMAGSGSSSIAGCAWRGRISVQEMMTFFGILIHLTLRPMPLRGSYVYAWSDPYWHPCTKFMALKRFQQIRSSLHLCNNEETTAVNDSLRKVRPLLTVVKKKLESYLDYGRELALDEASVASRSAYGKNLIFYNPTKNCGKYHFRFYMLCCSTTYSVVRFRLHTKIIQTVATG
ncbi:MAG: hypothetical protein ACREBR_03875, partial [bacterium]